jgi:hypothetical protein
MRTGVPEKLLTIADAIAERGSVNLTRLVVLKKWFEKPGRLSAFAIWIAMLAVSRKAKTVGVAAELFREARTLLAGADRYRPKLNRRLAETLHHRLRHFQDEWRKLRWGSARIIHNWNLMLIEDALAIYLWHPDSPADGYKLAADYCQNYDSRYGTNLNGPSRTKIHELVRFMLATEALEERQVAATLPSPGSDRHRIAALTRLNRRLN